MAKKAAICSILLFLLIFPAKELAYADELTHLIEATTEKASIYDNRTGKLIEVGKLAKGEIFPARRYGENWYEIKFADRTGYLYSPNVREVSNAVISNENKYYVPLGPVIKATIDTSVYDNRTGELVPFAKISINTKYPILSDYGNWYRVDVGGRIGYIHKNNTEVLPEKIASSNTSKIPVLMYHHILKKDENIFPKNNMIVNLESFKEQMNYLYRNGYQTISLSDMEAYIRGTIKLKEKTLLITFDDGLKTNHLYALPIFKEYGFQAGAFIITGRVPNSPHAFNPEINQSVSLLELEEMKSHFQLGSHTHALHQLTNNQSLVLVNHPNDVLSDFSTSKEFLKTPYFCYPFGQYNAKTIDLLKRAGYRAAYSTKAGYATTASNIYEIPRFGVYPYTSKAEFEKIVSGNR